MHHRMQCVASRGNRYPSVKTCHPSREFWSTDMTSTGKIALRPHQVEAVDAVVRRFDIPPGKLIPRNGLRATVVAACGTGKTFIAAHSALWLARNGRILVLLPTRAP
ncbi:DEAD/DEAH box helicase family protein [Streptomyces sp. NPDC051664]|uniref:DEAD/DEAH box helicase family protein n=1 Tax=Streptomyces sp. NPDC051664 TaxID=3365668 RepID=UPI0037A66FF3